MNPSDPYVLGRSERETRRLILQHQVFGPLTRRFFQTAGIGPGMKVLDIGSGAGDVALLAADLVGLQGKVVGVDLNAEILETARARTRAVGWTNVSFEAGDVRELGLDDDFDAVVGRWVLMHVPDPVALLRHAATRLRAGGIVAFHENDFTYPPTTFPLTSFSEDVNSWAIPPVDEAMRRWENPARLVPGRPEPQMGTKLYRTYVEAGLPGPQLMLEAAIGGGPDWPGYELFAETIRSLLPALQKTAGVDPEKVGVDTLAARLRKAVTERNGVHMMPMMIGAWSRKAR
jgi:SAM-dependent methyltransferase